MSGGVNYDGRGPSLERIAVSSQHDALVILEAARRGIIHVLRHRLSDSEKDINLKPGYLFVWEEALPSERSSRCPRRWTDGIKWSQSRVREPFLFYEQVPPFERTAQDRANRCANPPGLPAWSSSRTVANASATRARHPSRRDRVILPNGLKKLTFTAHVRLQPDDPRECWVTWRLVCYMSQSDRSMPSVQEHPTLRLINVPDGVYFDKDGHALDNAPRQTVRWPREAGAIDVHGRLTPPRDSSSHNHGYPHPYPHHQQYGGMRAPLSPPVSPDSPSTTSSLEVHDGRSSYTRSEYSEGPPSSYDPTSPRHITRLPQPGPNQYPARSGPAYPTHPPPQAQHQHYQYEREQAYHSGRYDHYPAHHHQQQQHRQERLPPLSELLRRPHTDLNDVRLPPPTNGWGWARREPEEVRTLEEMARNAHL